MLVRKRTSDTAANMAANAGGYITGAVNATVTDNATVAQLVAIDALTTGTLAYGALSDTATHLAANTGSYVAAATAILTWAVLASAVVRRPGFAPCPGPRLHRERTRRVENEDSSRRER